MEIYSRITIKRVPSPFEYSFEYVSGEILGVSRYARVFSITTQGKVKFNLSLEGDMVGRLFILPPVKKGDEYYVISECGEVVIIKDGKIVGKAFLNVDSLVNQVFLHKGKLYGIFGSSVYVFDENFKLIERRDFDGRITYSDKIGFVASPDYYSSSISDILVLSEEFLERRRFKARCGGPVVFSGDGKFMKEVCSEGERDFWSNEPTPWSVRIISLDGDEKVFQISDFEIWDAYRYGIFKGELVYHARDGEVKYKGKGTGIRGELCRILTGEESFIVSCDGGKENYIFSGGGFMRLGIGCEVVGSNSLHNEYKQMVEDGGFVYFSARCEDGEYVVKTDLEGNVIWKVKIKNRS